jgi:glycosyltransferase involved in cell wall biosynthesis
MGNVRLAPSAPAPVAASIAAATEKAGIPQAALTPASLKILHILRAPVGGLFRHVFDVAQGQAERGHRVGLILDSTTGGGRAEAALAELAPRLALGFTRVPIARQLSLQDIDALRHVARQIEALAPDVLHGHGAKGAALSRLASGAPHAIRVYTPHGGSLAHFSGTLRGGFYRVLEWMLKWRTDLFLFESNYIAEVFRSKIGPPRGIARVVHSGIGTAEFAPVRTRTDASDLVCLGELRLLKGIDVLIEALALLKQSGRLVSATIVGEGPDDAKLRAQMRQAGLADAVRFVGYRPAREAFAMGRVLVFPSLGESLPYVVLEAAAAAMPLIASRVGGVPEIFGAQADHLVSPGDAAALADAIGAALDDPAQLRRVTQAVRTRVRDEFSLSAMVDGGLAAYRETIAMRKVAQFA